MYQLFSFFIFQQNKTIEKDFVTSIHYLVNGNVNKAFLSIAERGILANAPLNPSVQRPKDLNLACLRRHVAREETTALKPLAVVAKGVDAHPPAVIPTDAEPKDFPILILDKKEVGFAVLMEACLLFSFGSRDEIPNLFKVEGHSTFTKSFFQLCVVSPGHA